MAEPLLVADGISKTIKNQVLVEPIDVKLGKGEVLALCGGNGAGKSTILRMIAGIMRPSGGSVRVNGWDWTRDRVAEEREVPVDVPLVVEGAGVLTPASRMLSDVQVWVESPTGSRRERALDRDGDAYRPHWERWAAQEEAHIRAHDPASLAVIIVDVP